VLRTYVYKVIVDPYELEWAWAPCAPEDVFFGYTVHGTVSTSEVEAERNPLLGLSLRNPMRRGGEFSITLPDEVDISLQVYNVAGRLVRALGERRMTPGAHTLKWDGKDGSGQAVVAGIYFIRLRAGERIVTRKLAVLE
jgi:flagellar hook assembly protein FlgD